MTTTKVTGGVMATAAETEQGAVEIATQAEVDAGTDATRSITPETLDAFITGKTDTAITAADEIAFADVSDSNATKKDTIQGLIDLINTPIFTSPEQTVTADTLLDVAHGLGARPTRYSVALRCKTTELGYAVDVEVTMFGSNNVTDQNVTVAADATNITIVQGAAIVLHDQTSFNFIGITVGNWKWVVRVWA